MSELVKVALDAMGGDNAPLETVKGAIDALAEADNLFVYLVGKEDAINNELAKYQYDKERIQVVNATEMIEMAEPPVMAIRKKTDSSMVKALYLVKNGEADGFVSAGSSGAVLVGGQLIVGRIKGVERAPFASIVPTAKGCSLLLDCGANVDAKPRNLVSFAQIGSVYCNKVLGIDNPKVGIINIGAEEEKGNALVKETFPLLKECEDINFVGSVEARDILNGDADVIVCEAFVGNVILKLIEGTAMFLVKEIKKGFMVSLKSKIGALLCKSALKNTMKSFSTESYGGAPVLGLNGLVIKTHGSSKSVEIKNSILQCITFKEKHINDHIKKGLGIAE